MADEEKQETPAAYEAPSHFEFGRSLRILTYVAMGALGLVLVSVISYYVARTAAMRQYREVSSIAVIKPPPPTENFNFNDEFRVNTADEGGRNFMRLKLSLGFQSGNNALSAELAQRRPQLRNIINLILTGKKRDELSSIESRLDLQEEIKASVNHILSNGNISEIYFSEFILN